MLVTGIQPRRVGAVNESHKDKGSPAPKDLGALDPCDEHRDEEIGVSVRAKFYADASDSDWDWFNHRPETMS
ncbi:hypothetical protein B5K11_15010 [Rhizobium leguminosarum bv. trifolii]|nr:hypothetical protein B5K11_15010 [Rhizobium leguminosarum bv. trifolii]